MNYSAMRDELEKLAYTPTFKVPAIQRMMLRTVHDLPKQHPRRLAMAEILKMHKDQPFAQTPMFSQAHGTIPVPGVKLADYAPPKGLKGTGVYKKLIRASRVARGGKERSELAKRLLSRRTPPSVAKEVVSPAWWKGRSAKFLAGAGLAGLGYAAVRRLKRDAKPAT